MMLLRACILCIMIHDFVVDVLCNSCTSSPTYIIYIYTYYIHMMIYMSIRTFFMILLWVSVSSHLESSATLVFLGGRHHQESILDISSAQGRSSFNVDLQDLLNEITHSPTERPGTAESLFCCFTFLANPPKKSKHHIYTEYVSIRFY